MILFGEPAADTVAARLARGVCRHLGALGYGTLTEFPLSSGRRVDVIGFDGGGKVTIVEIKSSVIDFRTDEKWTDYLEFCDAFYFAVPEGFPQALLPQEHGLMVADAYGAAVIRLAPTLVMNASRRRAQLLRLALIASQRLQRLVDPAP